MVYDYHYRGFLVVYIGGGQQYGYMMLLRAVPGQYRQDWTGLYGFGTVDVGYILEWLIL